MDKRCLMGSVLSVVVSAGIVAGELLCLPVAWGDNAPPVPPAYKFAPGNSSGPSTPEAKEAAVFFTKLAKDSDNPLIASWAKESLQRLSNPKLAMAGNAPLAIPDSATGRKEVSVSLLTQNNNSLAVPVLLNRKTVGTFIVDTGATYTVITPRLAQKLNVEITPETPRVSIITANGVIKAPVVVLERVTIGEMEVKNVKAIIQPLGDDLLLAGLLGMNFFQGMDMSVRQNKLILSVNP